MISFWTENSSCVFVLTWNLPASARAWARVQGQSMSSLRKLGCSLSRTSHCRHLFSAQAAESSLKVCSKFQVKTWALLQSPGSSLWVKQTSFSYFGISLNGLITKTNMRFIWDVLIDSRDWHVIVWASTEDVYFCFITHLYKQSMV